MRALSIFLLLTTVACGGESTQPSPAQGETPAATSGGEEESLEGSESSEEYADEARTLYESAMEDFDDEDCLAAEPAFRQVRREFPYSRYAALAQLRVGDCQMQQSEYAEAVQSFSSFVRYNASHAEVPYARFRIAEAHFEQIPTDWLLVPPSYERDLGSAQDALRYLRRFILDYPENEHVTEALEMARRSLYVLAGHELYAARYYLRRGSPEAAVMRLEALIDRYEGSEHDARAWLTLGQAYAELEAPQRARVAFETVIARWPGTELAEEAQSALEDLPPPAAPTPAAAAEEPAAEEPAAEEPAAEQAAEEEPTAE
jgi:outer membrane protein assembly factor BamD